jgi:hypothetical protein
MEIRDHKVAGCHAVIAQAISDVRSAIEANDTEVGAAFGLALAQLGGTAAGIDEIANFAKRHLTN